MEKKNQKKVFVLSFVGTIWQLFKQFNNTKIN